MHGLPQWNCPPKYSNVIQCMWPSTSPPTRPNGVAPRTACRSRHPASGNTAQPTPSSNRTGATRTPDCDVIEPSSSTRQSAAGWARRRRRTAVTNVPSGRNSRYRPSVVACSRTCSAPADPRPVTPARQRVPRHRRLSGRNARSRTLKRAHRDFPSSALRAGRYRRPHAHSPLAVPARSSVTPNVAANGSSSAITVSTTRRRRAPSPASSWIVSPS